MCSVFAKKIRYGTCHESPPLSLCNRVVSNLNDGRAAANQDDADLAVIDVVVVVIVPLAARRHDSKT
jgi:hypothetical protein